MKLFNIIVTKAGITRQIHGDLLTWQWPWVHGLQYYSNGFRKEFNTLDDYWDHRDTLWEKRAKIGAQKRARNDSEFK